MNVAGNSPSGMSVGGPVLELELLELELELELLEELLVLVVVGVVPPKVAVAGVGGCGHRTS